LSVRDELRLKKVLNIHYTIQQSTTNGGIVVDETDTWVDVMVNEECQGTVE